MLATVLGQGRGGGAPAETVLYEDLFTTTEAAPLASPRTAEPGPGTGVFVFTVTATAPSIGGGQYVRPRPTAGQSYTGYGYYTSTSFARAIGLMFYSVQTTTIMSSVLALGVHTSAALAQFPLAGRIFWGNTSVLNLNPGAGSDFAVGVSLSNGSAYQNAIILRSSGAHFFIQGGSQYAAWTRLYVSALKNDATLYATFPNFDSAVTLDTVRVRQKLGNWTSDYGGATYFDATPTANDTATGEADGLDYFVWTPAASETLSLYFRRISDDECYRLDCAVAPGNTIKLYRRTGGVDTELDAGKTQTFTAGLQYRIGITHAGGSIWTFVETTAVGVVAKHVVTGESFNLAAPGIKCAGFASGANWEVWKRALTGLTDADIAG